MGMKWYDWSPRRSQHETNTEFFKLMQPVFLDMESSVGNALAECFESLDERAQPQPVFPKPAHWAAYYGGGENPNGPTYDEQRLIDTIDKLKAIGRDHFPNSDWFGDDHFEPGAFSA